VSKASIVIVTPALSSANNGNWQTAARWRRFLAQDYRVALTDSWAQGDQALMIALHARRSAPSVAAWREQYPQRPLLLVLTGTDLYRDIAYDSAAQGSLAMADRLVVLNELGLQALPPQHRAKAHVCLQSSPVWQARTKTQRHLRVLMVGHLREEKSPRTYFEAARALQHRGDIRFDHIGAGLDPALAAEAQALMASHPRYRWLGALPRASTRRHIADAHVLVHPSQMEGGAHVVIEAITSGTPVLASAIDGNLGLLGQHYSGCFASGDSALLATLIAQARDDATVLPSLQRQCAARAALFAPAAEQQTLRTLVRQLLNPKEPTSP
jgi:putative glycosyltransferase (TIGR04348 family)